MREKLPWPGPRATAHLINTLHHKSQKPTTVYRDSLDSDLAVETASDPQGDSTVEEQPLLVEEGQAEWKARMKTLLRGATVSGVLVRQGPYSFRFRLL